MNENVKSKGIKAVVFDMAGTTVDEGNIVYESVKNALALYGYSYSLNEVMLEVGGMSKKEGIEKLIRKSNADHDDPQLINNAFNYFLKVLEERYKIDPDIKEMTGATELFSQLKENAIKVALNTGYSRSTVNILMDRMGWMERNLIDFSVASDEVEKGRPNPFMINKVAEAFGITPAQIAKVGDTQSDIEEGHNAGCTVVVGITSSKHDKKALLDMGATHAIDALQELMLTIAANQHDA